MGAGIGGLWGEFDVDLGLLRGTQTRRSRRSGCADEREDATPARLRINANNVRVYVSTIVTT